MTIKSLIAAGALALVASVSAAQAGPAGGLAQKNVTGVDATPVVHKNCFPLFGVRRVHVTGLSALVFRRVIVGWRCVPILTLRPEFRIPGPGPYARLPGRFNPRFNGRFGGRFNGQRFQRRVMR